VTKSRLLLDLSLVGVLGAAVVGSAIALARRGDDYTFFDELVDAQQLIARRYVQAPDEQKLREGAVKGMVEALNDPYTVYVPASEKRNFNKDLTGEYVGIGAQVNQQDGWLTIVSPLEESPAFRAGLMPEDRVVEVEGTSTHGKPIDECINMLLGEPGTKVNIVVERKGERIPVTITRERIKTRSVKGVHRATGDQNSWDYLIDPARKIAYIRLVQFTPGCSGEVEAALRSAGADTDELKGLVLDLRYNPGGLLDEAEKIADLFLEEGVIVSTRGRAYPEVVRRAEKPGTLPNFPIALLLNGQSASASEVLAGALTENNRAIAVGTRSFGKGSVQSVIELPHGGGSEIKLTEQGYYLPSGRSLTRTDDSATWGVDPTEGFYVPMSDEEVTAMIEVRRREELLHAGAAPARADAVDWSKADSALAYLKDRALTAAVRAMQGKVDSGEWTRTGEPGPQTGKINSSEMTKLNQYRERLMRELARTERRLDAIENADPAAAQQTVIDLWPDTLDLKGGTVEVRDKDGKVIATLTITGPNLERWLIDADLKKVEPPAGSGGGKN
jgi:carboxyl-terminal processing protease